MRNLALAAVLFLAAGFLVSTAHAEETYPPLTLQGTQVRDIEASSSGETFRVFIRTPQVPAPPEGFPVLYAVGANANFLYLVNLMRTGAENPLHPSLAPAIVVGIGFPTEKAYDLKRWIYDFTLPAQSYALPDRPNGKPWPAVGGADETLDFIENDLKPAIEQDFDVDPSKEILFGHSFGGLFTLHTLFTRPELFDIYLAASPSIWFNDGQVLDEMEAFIANPPADIAKKRLIVGVGGLEQGSFDEKAENEGEAKQAEEGNGEKRQPDFGMIDNAQALIDTLQKDAPALPVELQTYPGENHGTVLPVFLLRELPKALPPRRTGQKTSKVPPAGNRTTDK